MNIQKKYIKIFLCLLLIKCATTSKKIQNMQKEIPDNNLNQLQTPKSISINNSDINIITDSDKELDNNDEDDGAIFLSGYNEVSNGNSNYNYNDNEILSPSFNSIPETPNNNNYYYLDITHNHIRTSIKTHAKNLINRNSKICSHYSNFESYNIKEKGNLLHYACKLGSGEEVLKFFCNHCPIYLSEKDIFQKFPIDYLKRGTECYENIKVLNKAPSKIDNELINAFNSENLNKIQQLIQEDKNYLLMIDYDKNTLLHLAYVKQNYKLAKLVLDIFPSLIDKVNINGDTPLDIGIEFSNNELLKLLLFTKKSIIKNKTLYLKNRVSIDALDQNDDSILIDELSDTDEKISNQFSSDDSDDSENSSIILTQDNLLEHEKNLSNKLKLKKTPSSKSYYKSQANKHKKDKIKLKSNLKKVKSDYIEVSNKFRDQTDENEDLNQKFEDLKHFKNLELDEEAMKIQMQKMKLEHTQKNLIEEIQRVSSIDMINYNHIDNKFINNNQNPDWHKKIKRQHTYESHNGIIWDSVFDNNGKYFISVSNDDTIKIWDIEDKSLRLTLNSEEAKGEICLDYKPSINSSNFVSGGKNKNINLWDIIQEKTIVSFNAHKDSIYKLKFNYNGTILASSSSNNKLKLWDTNKNEIISTINTKSKRIITMCFHPNANYIVTTGENEKVIKLWDLRNIKQPLKTYKGHKNQILGLIFSPNGKYLASRDQTSFRVMNIKTSKWLYGKQYNKNENKNKFKCIKDHYIPDQISFNKDSTKLAVINNQFFSLWDSNGSFIQKRDTHRKIFNLIFSKTREIISTWDKKSKIKLYLPINN